MATPNCKKKKLGDNLEPRENSLWLRLIEGSGLTKRRSPKNWIFAFSNRQKTTLEITTGRGFLT